MIQKNQDILRRSRRLCQGKRGNGPVVYWMERDQRLIDNWALLFARQEALIRHKPLHVIYCLTDDELDATSGRQDFSLAGLSEIRQQACGLNIGFEIFLGAADAVLPPLLKANDCHLLVTDHSPLRHKQQMCERIGEAIAIPFFEVDAHNIIPSWILSDKKEYAAYTLRPKVRRLLDDFLSDFPQLISHPLAPVSIALPAQPRLEKDRHTRRKIGQFTSGTSEAHKRMQGFVNDDLQRYEQERNDPTGDAQSDLSPYLHSGQLAPQRLALAIDAANTNQQSKEAFLEELIVRRELAENFCFYEPSYDSFEGFPGWAQKTLNEHRQDKRRHLYTLEELEKSETHEALWNCCQQDLRDSHKLHGFLRMYWAKKILEWTASPEEALDYANFLNDKYSLDGCDPNGYTGTAWSIGGVHDRAWQEREVFGKIRYMNERGCRRKFKVDNYITAHCGDSDRG